MSYQTAIRRVADFINQRHTAMTEDAAAEHIAHILREETPFWRVNGQLPESVSRRATVEIPSDRCANRKKVALRVHITDDGYITGVSCDFCRFDTVFKDWHVSTKYSVSSAPRNGEHIAHHVIDVLYKKFNLLVELEPVAATA